MHNILFPLTYLGLEPFMINLAQALQGHLGLNPTYLAVTPAEAEFASNNLPHESLVLALGDSGHQVVDHIALEGLETESVYGFMKAKYGGSDEVWRQRVNILFEIVNTVILERNISTIIVWNGNDCLGKVCQILAQKHGLKILYLENGYFPNTLQIDPRGVNADASICDLSPGDWARANQSANAVQKVEPIRPSPVVQLRFLQRLRLKFMSRLDRRYYERYPELRDQKFKKRVQTSLVFSSSEEVIARKKPFALVVLQVHDDTQMLLNSKLFKTPRDFLKHCYDSIREVYGPDYDIVVKLHPVDVNRICYADLAAKLTQVSWIGVEPVEPLLDACQVVMVINSSVGLQSIAMRKPTLVFGESFYSRSEVCKVIRSLDETCAVLGSLGSLDARVEADQIGNFLNYLNGHYFVNGSWNIKPDSDLAPAVQKIELLLTDV